jgi:hypothetical protein
LKDGRSCKIGNKKFSYDNVLGMNCTQEEVYLVAAKPIIDRVMQGFNGTVFAYGQTSAGKTHTMSGSKHDPGIIPRTIDTVFKTMAEADINTIF